MLGIMWSKRTSFNLITTISQFLVLLLCNFLFVETFTIYGTAFSLLVSNIFYIMFTFYLSQRYYPIRVDWAKIMTLFVFAIIVHLSVILDYYSSDIGFLLLKYVGFFAYVIFSFFVVTQKQDRVWFYSRCKAAICK